MVDSRLDLDVALLMVSGDERRVTARPTAGTRVHQDHEGLTTRWRRPVGVVTEWPTDDVSEGTSELHVDERIEDVVERETDRLHNVRQFNGKLQQPIVHCFTAKHNVQLENIDSRIDMQTHAGSSSTRP